MGQVKVQYDDSKTFIIEGVDEVPMYFLPQKKKRFVKGASFYI